jgi:hypothetical protein
MRLNQNGHVVEETAIEAIRPVHPGPFGPTDAEGVARQPGIEEQWVEYVQDNTPISQEKILQWVPHSISVVNFSSQDVYVSFGKRSIASLINAVNQPGNLGADLVVQSNTSRLWPWPVSEALVKRLRYYVPPSLGATGKFHIIIHNVRYAPSNEDLSTAGTIGTVNIAPNQSVNTGVTKYTSFNHGQVSVGTSATQIRPSSVTRVGCTIVNTSPAATVYVGDDNTVTTSTGYPLLPQTDMVLDPEGGTYNGEIWGITSGATVAVGYAMIQP